MIPNKGGMVFTQVSHYKRRMASVPIGLSKGGVVSAYWFSEGGVASLLFSPQKKGVASVKVTPN